MWILLVTWGSGNPKRLKLGIQATVHGCLYTCEIKAQTMCHMTDVM